MVQRQRDSLLLSSVRQRRITNSRHNKKSRFQSVARPRFVPCLFGQMPRPDYPVALHLATFNVGQAGLTRLRSIRTREWSNRFAFCSFFLFYEKDLRTTPLYSYGEFLFLWLCGEIAWIDQVFSFLGLEIFLEGISHRYIARYDREEKF